MAGEADVDFGLSRAGVGALRTGFLVTGFVGREVVVGGETTAFFLRVPLDSEAL